MRRQLRWSLSAGVLVFVGIPLAMQRMDVFLIGVFGWLFFTGIGALAYRACGKNILARERRLELLRETNT